MARPVVMRSRSNQSANSAVHNGKLPGINTEQAADRDTGFLRGLATGFAGTGIGNAGIDDQRTDFLAGSEMLAANLDRRGTEAVLRKHAGHRATCIEHHQRQIAPVLLADFGLGHPKTNPGNREKLIGSGGSVIDGHF